MDDLKERENLMMMFLEKANEVVNLNERDKVRSAEEITYKSSNLYISVNFGIIAAGSFIFSNPSELSNFSKFLVLFLLGSIISIICEIKYRNEILKWNIIFCEERITKVQDNSDSFMKELKDKLTSSVSDYGIFLNDFGKKQQDALDEVYDKLRAKDKELSNLRKWSLRLLFSSIISLILVLIVESGLFEILSNLCQP